MIDQFLSRRRTKQYNCVAFANEVWQAMTGTAVDLNDVRRTAVFLSKPVSPCFVLMQRRGLAHVGIWWRGKVLHLLESGVHYMPLEIASVGYPKVRFFLCK